jgi:flagellin FlaB
MDTFEKNRTHHALFTLFNLANLAFFTIGLVFVYILINIGFSVTDSEKKVVIETMEKIDEHLVIAGNIVANADVYSNELKITATPVKTASSGAVNIDPQEVEISYKLIQGKNYTISYDNIYVGSLNNTSFNTVQNAVEFAKNSGLVEINPFVDNEKPTSTKAFVYWIVNQNFDQRIDSDELAVLTIIYADQDRPSTAEDLVVQMNVKDGYIFKLEREIPNISSSVINFGGMVKKP